MKPGDERTRAESTAEAIGVVIGAASTCDWVSEERLQATIDKSRDAVIAIARDDIDAAAAVNRFAAGFDSGKAAVEKGRASPQQVENALSTLERELLA